MVFFPLPGRAKRELQTALKALLPPNGAKLENRATAGISGISPHLLKKILTRYPQRILFTACFLKDDQKVSNSYLTI
jgi:hypothetical protein